MRTEKAIRLVLALQIAGFALVALVIWLDELFDLPAYLYGVPPVTFSLKEATYESLAVLSLGAVIVAISYKMVKRIERLESFLPICAYCKKIRKPDTDPEKQDSWQQMEVYITNKTGSEFSHGLCPACLEKHYGKFLRGEKKI